MMTNEDANGERRRLQPIYAGLADSQLLNLLRERDELTEVAQEVLDAERASRGLELPVDDPGPQDDLALSDEPAASGEELVFLMRLALAAEVDAVAAQLEGADIPFEVMPVNETEKSSTSASFSLFVPVDRKQDAESLLRRSLGFFPLAEVDYRGNVESEFEGDEGLFPLGDFELKVAETAKQALRQAGIWFREEPTMTGRDEITGLPQPEMVFLEVRFDDLAEATHLVDQALKTA